MDRWNELTKLERRLLVVSVLLFAMFIGVLVGCRIPDDRLNWNAIGSLVAFVALCVAGVGYFDNRKAQRLEHRAYVRCDIDGVSFDSTGRVAMSLKLTNLGRTPAASLKIEVICFTKLSNALDPDAPIGGPVMAHHEIRTIFPGAPDEPELRTEEGFNEDDYKLVEHGAATLYISVKLTYLDVFKEEKTDSFPFKYCSRYSNGALIQDYRAEIWEVRSNK
ncbi:MAG: hypothetical protein NVV72_01245 [Asticcacaulis sp.]|nr:hypothetical protein [Asticcacaulis sp.]